MTVSGWEFESLAIMMIASYGDNAQSEARQRLERARCEKNRGQSVVWMEVLSRIAGASPAAVGHDA